MIKRQYKFEYSALMTFFIKVNVNRKLIYDIYIYFLKAESFFILIKKKTKLIKSTTCKIFFYTRNLNNKRLVFLIFFNELYLTYFIQKCKLTLLS